MAETVNVTSINENPLCARLQKKFAGRGAASAGTKAVKNVYNTVKDTKIARTADPFEETTEFVRAGGTKKAASSANAYNVAARARATTAKSARTATAYNSSAFDKTTTFERATFKKAYDRAASIREKAVDYNASTRQIPCVKKANIKSATKTADASKPSFKEWFKSLVMGDDYEEKKVKSTPVSKGLILSGLVIAFIVILMIFSFAQINEFKNEISGLESRKADLLTRIDDLNVAIDAKNDIRMIEAEATAMGMVKSNQVTTKYISLSDGERVEVIDASAESGEGEYGVFGTLMSVIGSNWDHVMEYIN